MGKIRFSESLLLIWAFVGSFLATPAWAVLNSPSAKELGFSYQADFVTAAPGGAHGLALSHARFLFGYFQNHSQSKALGLPEENDGVGAPLWPPKVTVTAETKENGLRHIHYLANGRIIVHRAFANWALAKKSASDLPITLPYDLDHFFLPACADWDDRTTEDFWYSYDPFQAGCQTLGQAPLAASVKLHLKDSAPAPTLSPRFEELRGNGQRTFLVVTVDGFDDDLMAPDDLGRVSYEAIGAWLRGQGFSQRTITKERDSEIRSYEKTLVRPDGLKIPVRVLRFLGETEISEPNSVAYARFMVQAIHDADVIVYQGHSGFGRNMEISQLEARAGRKVVINDQKRQLFFFDSCTSYSYYLPIFANLKRPGSLDLVTNGIESMTDKGVSVDEEFYRALFDTEAKNSTWNKVLGRMEAKLSGLTFLLNVFRAMP